MDSAPSIMPLAASSLRGGRGIGIGIGIENKLEYKERCTAAGYQMGGRCTTWTSSDNAPASSPASWSSSAIPPEHEVVLKACGEQLLNALRHLRQHPQLAGRQLLVELGLHPGGNDAGSAVA